MSNLDYRFYLLIKQSPVLIQLIETQTSLLTLGKPIKSTVHPACPNLYCSIHYCSMKSSKVKPKQQKSASARPKKLEKDSHLARVISEAAFFIDQHSEMSRVLPKSLQDIQPEEFESEELSLRLLDFMVQRRIFRDADINAFFDRLVQLHPAHEAQIKQALVDVLTALDD